MNESVSCLSGRRKRKEFATVLLPWLFLCLQQVSIWCSWVQILLIEQWTVFENCVFQGFVGSDPFEEGMDWFCSGWFVNNLCLKQKTERIWNLVVGSSPFGRLFLTVYLKKRRREKTGEISRNLPFSLVFSVGSFLTDNDGRGRRIRTRDPRFWRPVLYQLSYTPVQRLL